MDSIPPNLSQIEYVPLASEHINGLVSVERVCFSDPWSEDMFVALLSNPLAVYTVALCDGSVIGYAGMYHILTEGQIMNIAVIPEYRRQGIAEKLLSVLEEYARDNDVEVLTLEVRKANAPAISLYEKLGFEKVGERKGYYQHPCDDAVLMNLSV